MNSRRRLLAGGVIGADAVAKSAPDGYTFVLGTISSHAINPVLQPKMPYDAAKDFVPTFFIGNIANMPLCGAQQPYRSVKDVIAAAKANVKREILTAEEQRTQRTQRIAESLLNSSAQLCVLCSSAVKTDTP